MGLNVPVDVVNRIRMELGMHRQWFKGHGVNGKRSIDTVADLMDYVEKQHEGSWKKFINTEIKRFVDRACLIKMFTFDGKAVIEAFRRGDACVPGLGDLPTKYWVMMLEARMERKLTFEMIANKIERNKVYDDYMKAEYEAVSGAEIAQALALDMGKLGAQSL